MVENDKFLCVGVSKKKITSDKYKKLCEELGVTSQTEGFDNDILKLMDKE